ncbi:PilW family protein [Zooshikella ganghwensis]|uniref:PilW family protein n=1 Tax=Zooshikella ganghwensis TaxID=202772 RepID=UPI0003F7F5FD|nr:PilW family protein [Zooshikella ganghwensis]
MKKQQGFTIIELMIAMLLGLFLMGGIISIFNSNQQTFRMLNGLSTMQDNARFAFDTISQDIRMAGYMGCLSSINDVNYLNTLNPSSSDYIFDLSTGLTGYEASGSTWKPHPESYVTDLEPQTGSDILVIRRVSDNGASLTQAMPFPSADLKTEATAPIEDSEVILVSDCSKATIFQVTNITTTVDDTEYNVVHNAGTSESPGNAQKELTNDGSTYDEDASVYKFRTAVYYIAPSAFTNNRGNQVLSLWRRESLDPAEELIRGVEDLAILYGEDLDSSGVPNRYVTASNVGDMNRVVAVNISLSVNTVDEVSQDNNLITRTFNATIKIRNRGV